MRDTSIIERQIHSKVMDLCFESIVSEVFITSLPVPQNELTDGLTQQFAQYATECLKDLGSASLLQSAMEGEQDPAKKNYLRKMYSLCMETANNVTARILEEYKDDDQLKDAAANVTLTQKEYDKFSKAAATLTPATLSDMIQKKTLDVIETEREAYQKDAELESELKAALGTADDEEAELPPDADDSTEPPEEPLNMESDDPTGADIGTEDDDPSADLPEIPDGASLDAYMFPATESLRDWFAKRKEIKGRINDAGLRGKIGVGNVKQAEKLKPQERLAAALIGFCAAKNVDPITNKSEATRVIGKSYPSPTIEMFEDVPVCVRDDADMTLLFAGKTDKGETMCFAMSEEDTIMYAAFQIMIMQVYAGLGMAAADTNLQNLMNTQLMMQQQMAVQQQQMMFQQQQQMAYQAHVNAVNAHSMATMGFPTMCSLMITNGESATEGLGAIIDTFKGWMAANKDLRERAKFRPSAGAIAEAEKLPREKKIAAAIKGTLWYLGPNWSLYDTSAAASVLEIEKKFSEDYDNQAKFRYEDADGIPIMVCVTGMHLTPDATSAWLYEPGTVFFVACKKNGKPSCRFITMEGLKVCPATYLEKVAPTEKATEAMAGGIYNYGKYRLYEMGMEGILSNIASKIRSFVRGGKGIKTPQVTDVGGGFESIIDWKDKNLQTAQNWMTLMAALFDCIAEGAPDATEIRAIGVTGPKNLNALYYIKDDTHISYDGSGKVSGTIYMGFIYAQQRNFVDPKATFYIIKGKCLNGHLTGMDIEFDATPIPDPKIWCAEHSPYGKDHYRKNAMTIANHGDPSYETFLHYNYATGAIESAFTDMMNKSGKNDPIGAAIGQHGGEAAGKAKDPKKAQEAFDGYMRGMAGDNYRAKHATVFSRLQELSYEALCATTESYTEVPFDTMRVITTQNTFDRFSSHDSKSIKAVMESIGRFAFESEATPDAPSDTPLKDSLLCASIIYTFFETLNSMNLYCPKLNEIRKFVDESLPVEGKRLKDQKAFIDLFKGMMAQAQSNLAHAQSVPEVDAIQGDLDIVRERCAAPGFESMRATIDQGIHNLQTNIDRKRDKLVAAQRPAQAAVESATQMMHRTRDTLKFSRTASVFGRKPNVDAIKFKIDVQGQSPYIAVECYTANNTVANKTTIVLEGSGVGYKDMVDYVTAAMEASTLKDLHKRYILTDSRNGKLYFDSERR